MINKRSFIFVFALVLTAVSAIFQCFGATKELLGISLPILNLEKGERIVGFSIKMKSAYIKSLPSIPIAWSMNINNFLNETPPWNTTLEAVAGVGAAALNQEFFNNFLVAEQYSGDYAEKLDVEIRIFTTVDFDSPKERVFHIDDLVLKRILTSAQ